MVEHCAEDLESLWRNGGWDFRQTVPRVDYAGCADLREAEPAGRRKLGIFVFFALERERSVFVPQEEHRISSTAKRAGSPLRSAVLAGVMDDQDGTVPLDADPIGRGDDEADVSRGEIGR